MRINLASTGTPFLRDFNGGKSYTCAGIYGIDLVIAYMMVYNTNDEQFFMFVLDGGLNRLSRYMLPMFDSSSHDNILYQAIYKTQD